MVGIGVIEGVECVILGHDPSVRAGAFNPFNAKKLMRGLEIARENRMPYVQFVESAGADLRGEGGGDGGDPNKAAEASIRRDHRITLPNQADCFTKYPNCRKCVPTVSVVFGAATAGGAYQPGMSDYNIMVKNQAMVSLGGPPLVKMATGEDANAEDLGGADMHTQISGLGDYLAQDEMDGIRYATRGGVAFELAQARARAKAQFEEPVHDPEDMLGLVSKDLKTPLDIREVVMRVVDDSKFEEFKPLYGPTVVCGWASVQGYPVGIVGNNGALFSEAAEKAAQFIQLCNQIDVPILFLHNITGFIVGTDFEQGGITKNGSKMVNAVSNSTVPHILLAHPMARELRHEWPSFRH